LFIFHQATRHLFVPADKKIPKIRIETRQYDKLKDQRVIVAIDTWPRTSRYPLVCVDYLYLLLLYVTTHNYLNYAYRAILLGLLEKLVKEKLKTKLYY